MAVYKDKKRGTWYTSFPYVLLYTRCYIGFLVLHQLHRFRKNLQMSCLDYLPFEA